MLRILTHVNYSNPKNPAADSGIQMQACLTRAVVDAYPDVFFYVLLPREAEKVWAEAFAHPRISLLVAPLPARQRGGAFHFDASVLDQLADLKRIDVDLLLLNQPELAPAFLDYFNKRHFFHVPAITYIHWVDWRRHDSIKNRAAEPAVLAALSGAVLSTKVGCNSAHGKKRILQLAQRWFASEVVGELADKLVVLPPGIDIQKIRSRRNASARRRIKIIVPHRALKYTGFKTLLDSYLPSVWKVRQDFEVILTNPSRFDFIRNYKRKHPFVRVEHDSREEYSEALADADIVIGSHFGSNQWSVAALEAICSGCVPLLNHEGFFREMLQSVIRKDELRHVETSWFYYRSEFASRLLALMDNLDAEKKIARRVGRRARAYYAWDTVAQRWHSLFQAVAQVAPMVGSKSPALLSLVKEVKTRGRCTKAALLKKMDWHPKSRHIPWTKYRRRLLTRVQEVANQSEVEFYISRARPSGTRIAI